MREKELTDEGLLLLGQARALLEDLERLGIHTVELPPERQELPVCAPGTPPGAGGACRPETLEEIRSELEECGCCELCKGRNRLVFGVGNPRARLVFVGEAPGREEDLRGEPFVGEAGRLLDRMLAAMELSREEVYICNVLKCRPPRNRDPRPEEIEACEPFLRRQLAAIGPELIVALGKFAAQTLLRDTSPIGKLRGRWREYAGIPLLPTFHPAYLLRNPASKREAWEDLKQVLQRLRESGGG